MSRGPYKKRTEEVDYRQILSLLPGRMIVKQLIDRELATIRQVVKAGQHPEYLALLPGLEMEEQTLRAGLGTMADLMQPIDMREHPVKVVTPRALLEAPEGEKKSVLDVSRLLPMPFIEDRPIGAWLMLKELMEHGEFSRKEFVEKYGGKHPSLKGSGMSMALSVLRRVGVKLKLSEGRVVLVSKLTGELPTGTYREMRKGVKTVSEPVPEPQEKPKRKTGQFYKSPGGLSQAEYLLQAFETSPDHIININAQWKRMKARSYTSVQVAVSQLKRKKGLRIITLGNGRYQLKP